MGGVREILRRVVETVRVFLSCNCSMHAAGLTYFAMLALVPLLCCVLVAAKGLGVYHFARAQIDLHLASLLGSLASEQALLMQARRITNDLFTRLDAFDVSTLGWIGFACLIWTVVSSLGRVELSFNTIWNIPRPRPILRRVPLYFAALVILSVFVFLAMSLPTLKFLRDVLVRLMGSLWLTKWCSDSLIALVESGLFRYAVTLTAATCAFAFLYWFLPNGRVRCRAALCGGALTACAFAAWLKLCAVAQLGIARSSALYGSFSFFPIALAWLYMSWQIVLFGAAFTRVLDGGTHSRDKSKES